jgi:cyclopropane-fatty-acyl-phospholipid synthase
MSLGLRLAEAGRLPDFLLRAAIRARHREVLRREDPGSAQGRQEALRTVIRSMEAVPVAPAPQDSNLQHYEVPPALFQEMLGPWLKYSACLWPEEELGRRPRPNRNGAERETLGQAEEAMLALTAERAGVQNGMHILDLGCGWGSFSLWAAERFPEARLVAVSNSRDQGVFIRNRARERRLENIQAITADMNNFQPPAQAVPFDRIVSVEMFEHMGNWPELLRRISGWLTEAGLFFMHIFAHKRLAYSFQDGPREWMSRNFFAGGIMPADALPLHLQRDLVLVDHWIVSGLHYARTLESWLALLDSRRQAALEILSGAYGPDQATVRLNRWRLFLMACSELFAFQRGNEWHVSHYLMARRPS